MSNGLACSQPLKWHGGKFYLARRITALFPEHIHYVEPYFGGGAVLLSKPDSMIAGHSEVINDLNGELTNFWSMLRDSFNFTELIRALEATPFSSVSWAEAAKTTSDNPLDRAVNFFIRYRQSRQGIGRDFATMSRSRTRRGMNEQVSSWLSAIDGLPEVHARLKRVVIFNEDALRVIAREDSKDTLFYLDPPYLHETRTTLDCYSYEMNFAQHEDLLSALSKLKGKFLLSGYPSELYDEYSSKLKWSRVDIAIDNKASSKKEKPIKTECLWKNY